MTPHEERLVLQLHSKWGNRWSRIARKLPGRTDNEIKNYWRTLMRKKKGTSSSSSSSSTSSSSSRPAKAAEEPSFYDTGGLDLVTSTPGENKTGLEIEESNKLVSMDDIWKEFEFPEENSKIGAVASPIWDYCPNDSLWCVDDYFQSFPFHNYMMG